MAIHKLDPGDSASEGGKPFPVILEALSYSGVFCRGIDNGQGRHSKQCPTSSPYLYKFLVGDMSHEFLIDSRYASAQSLGVRITWAFRGL